MIKASQIKNLKTQISNEMSRAIKTEKFKAFAEQLQRVCGVLVLKDFILEDEFLAAVRSNQTKIYGDWEVRSSGKAYYVDWTAEQVKEKEITTACGKKVKVNYVVCNEPFDSQVPNAYTDILKKNIDKQITVFLNRDELRDIACGDNTFDELVSLIESKIQSATVDMIYNTVLCEINNPENYKQIYELTYCCDRCEGKSLLSALNTFALKLQRNTAPFNLQSHDYTLPIREMFLIKSYEMDSRIMGILSNTYNQDMVNIQTKFNLTPTLDINIADFIIADKRWIQLHEVLNEVEWEYSIKKRGNCGIGNYIARFKLINFLTAVPVKLKKLDCQIVQEAEDLRIKIESLNEKIEADTQSEAESVITTLLNNQKKPESKLTISQTFKNFTAPSDQKDGAITADIEIKSANGDTLETFSKDFILKKK